MEQEKLNPNEYLTNVLYKTNFPYHKKLGKLIEFIQKNSTSKPKLLLHACCAPCSSHVIEYLSNFFDITIYYYNPNIHPQNEYNRRLQELKTFLNQFPPAIQNKINLIECEYNQEDFYIYTNVRKEKELQTEPEKGERCRRCYLFRMKKAYDYALQNGFDFFTTTLSISPYKDADKINTIGLDLDSFHFLPSDFKKNNGFLRSLELSKEYNLYRQDYCGCIYSMHKEQI